MTVPGGIVGLLFGTVENVIVVDAANFDGSNGYAKRGAGLTGIADSKLFTFAGWAKSELTGSFQDIFTNATTVGGSNKRLGIAKDTNNKLEIIARNAAGTNILNITSSSALPNAWTWVGVSVDLADTGKRHLYFGNTNELDVTTYTNDTIDFTVGDWSVGALPNGVDKFDGGLSELLFWPGVYIDLSIASNRSLLHSAGNKPIDPNMAGGAIAVLGSPMIYFHLDDGETANNFVANNDGGATGGAFTVTGALSTYASSPSD